ncbi:MAG TPA: aminotransferase class V-fold PLP-dependent enzyme [Vicinamibacterales bacterium]|nr:aminotransferase class V-fold PLP-dependent enzyme [Vicinamibacterales bacterium]
MNERDTLLTRAARHAQDYLAAVADRPVRATLTGDELRRLLGGPLPDQGDPPLAVIDRLAGAAGSGTVASQGPRYFGFVVGGSYPAATAADWLVSAWDQNCGIFALSPLVSVVEDIAIGWVRGLAGLPASWNGGFVTGCQMANFAALAAARHHVSRSAGWDIEANGLVGAPPIEVVVSDEAHYTIFMALRMLGLGAARARRVPTDGQGRMRTDELAAMLRDGSGPCIVCAQAGNVNTGAFDPIADIADAARSRGAWLHVDGAFGLWAAASPSLSGHIRGIDRADSIATDGHKWLNVPYDCGIVLTAHPSSERAAFTLDAAYIVRDVAERDPHEFVPEESRRGRAVPVYAVLRALGRQGLRDLVDRCCALARRMAAALQPDPAVRILNDVVLNQVLVRFEPPGGGDADAFTRQVIAGVQEDGTCWAGGTTWHGMAAMRISISNWSTTEADIDRSAEAIRRVATGAGVSR